MSESTNILGGLLNDELDLGEMAPEYDPFAVEMPNNPVFDQAANAEDAEEVPDESEEPEELEEPEDPEEPEDEPISNVQLFPPKMSAAAENPAPTLEICENPLAAAMKQAEEKQTRASAASIFAKPPVFTYGSAKEDITEKELTFEQLRIAKCEDFPELDDQKRVSWSMEYGTITKQVPKPKEMVIHKLKEEIEISKEFLEMLKKQKDKNALVCKVKPHVTAQSKGIASYKGVFTSMEQVNASGKAICILPARDGQVYEIRCTDAGRFIVPISEAPELPEVSADFFPYLPRIPFSLICQVIGFFRHFMGERQLEAMVHIYWDKQLEEYRIAVPKQHVGKASVEAQLDLADVLDEARYLCFADIHSHNSMPAKFSQTDDRDERATRVYLVIGRLDSYFPEINARISCGGHFLPIPLGKIIEDIPGDFPTHWTDTVSVEHIWPREDGELI